VTPMPESTATKYTFGRTMLEHWPLDPAITYLNHGTVGAVPKRVLAAQAAICAEIERQPARFLLRELADSEKLPMRMPPRMRTAAFELASFVRTEPGDLAFVDNATTGCNAVLRSFPFEPGDEILVTDHGYGAVTKAATYVASRFGGRVNVATLPFPGTTPKGIVAAITGALTERTRLLVVDHVTSGSALVLPVAEIAAACRERGVVTLIDGAHAPGMLDLDIPALGADFYTGNLHKWALSPRSCAILWAPPERQADLHPTVISWGYGHGMSAEFDLLGTRDPSPWLAAPAGVAFMRELGLEAMRTYNHRLAYETAVAFTERWGTAIPAPESMYGSMVTIPLPDRYGDRPEAARYLKDALLYDDHIEAQVHAFKDRIWLRIAAQVYNDASDYERLRDAIERRG
jgi:isopenicillin-N epimerase